jgi:hypothetical protein
MKKLIIVLITTFIAFVANAQHHLIKDCVATLDFGFESKIIYLSGKVKVITDPKEYADFNVKVITSSEFADVYVKKVKTRPSECGEWQFVESKKDAEFTVRFVDKGEDFDIKFVTSNPGCRY